MSGPELTRFDERLRAVLHQARIARVLHEREYEALLVDPDFDPIAFERFRAEAIRSGLAASRGRRRVHAPPTRSFLRGEAERDLLDIYLRRDRPHPAAGSCEELLELAARAARRRRGARASASSSPTCASWCTWRAATATAGCRCST